MVVTMVMSHTGRGAGAELESKLKEGWREVREGEHEERNITTSTREIHMYTEK